MNWDDVNVLRKLPDGWYSVPSGSEYGKMISESSDMKYNDSVKKAMRRHEDEGDGRFYKVGEVER